MLQVSAAGNLALKVSGYWRFIGELCFCMLFGLIRTQALSQRMPRSVFTGS